MNRGLKIETVHRRQLAFLFIQCGARRRSFFLFSSSSCSSFFYPSSFFQFHLFTNPFAFFNSSTSQLPQSRPLQTIHHRPENNQVSHPAFRAPSKAFPAPLEAIQAPSKGPQNQPQYCCSGHRPLRSSFPFTT